MTGRFTGWSGSGGAYRRPRACWRETELDPLATFRAVNVAGTLALARQAAQAGVKRFVFSVQSRLTAR